MQQLVSYTGLVPPGMYIDKVIKVAKQELLQARDRRHEAESAPCHAPCHAPLPRTMPRAMPRTVQCTMPRTVQCRSVTTGVRRRARAASS